MDQRRKSKFAATWKKKNQTDISLISVQTKQRRHIKFIFGNLCVFNWTTDKSLTWWWISRSEKQGNSKQGKDKASGDVFPHRPQWFLESPGLTSASQRVVAVSASVFHREKSHKSINASVRFQNTLTRRQRQISAAHWKSWQLLKHRSWERIYVWSSETCWKSSYETEQLETNICL